MCDSCSSCHQFQASSQANSYFSHLIGSKTNSCKHVPSALRAKPTLVLFLFLFLTPSAPSICWLMLPQVHASLRLSNPTYIFLFPSKAVLPKASDFLSSSSSVCLKIMVEEFVFLGVKISCQDLHLRSSLSNSPRGLQCLSLHSLSRI